MGTGAPLPSPGARPAGATYCCRRRRNLLPPRHASTRRSSCRVDRPPQSSLEPSPAAPGTRLPSLGQPRAPVSRQAARAPSLEPWQVPVRRPALKNRLMHLRRRGTMIRRASWESCPRWRSLTSSLGAATRRLLPTARGDGAVRQHVMTGTLLSGKRSKTTVPLAAQNSRYWDCSRCCGSLGRCCPVPLRSPPQLRILQGRRCCCRPRRRLAGMLLAMPPLLRSSKLLLPQPRRRLRETARMYRRTLAHEQRWRQGCALGGAPPAAAAAGNSTADADDSRAVRIRRPPGTRRSNTS